jgi:sortase A
LKRALSLVLLVAGAAFLAQGGYIYAKACLAQVLLDRAWQAARAGDADPRPWPWADTHAVARLSSAKHGVDLVVLAGATGASTAFAPAHITGTASPGQPGHIAVAAHRDTHFSFLRQVELGDQFELQPRVGPAQQFEVDRIRVVDRHQTSLLSEPGSRLTLVTCYPFDAPLPGGTQRYVVQARRVAPPPAVAANPSS